MLWLVLLRTTLAGDEDADALDHLSRRAGSLGQEDIGGAGAVEGRYRSRDNHRRQCRVKLFRATDELVAVHLGHVQIREQEIE